MDNLEVRKKHLILIVCCFCPLKRVDKFVTDTLDKIPTLNSQADGQIDKIVNQGRFHF